LFVPSIAHHHDSGLDVADGSGVDRRALEMPIDRAVEGTVAPHDAVCGEDPQARVVRGTEVSKDVADRRSGGSAGAPRVEMREGGFVPVVPVCDVHAAFGEAVAKLADGEAIADGPDAVLLVADGRLGRRPCPFNVS